MEDFKRYFKWAPEIIFVICVVWLFGIWFEWAWSDFWSNFFSNAGSSAVIGLILYWIITRPDEKKSKQERKNQALAMLKIEFEINLERARKYGIALKKLLEIFLLCIHYALLVAHGMP